MSHFFKISEQLDTLLGNRNCVKYMPRRLFENILVYSNLSEASKTKVHTSLQAVGKDSTVQTLFNHHMQTTSGLRLTPNSSPGAYFRDKRRSCSRYLRGDTQLKSAYGRGSRNFQRGSLSLEPGRGL
mmetsp:Transcript_3764/g.5140  ORF Transcript_3764/g.5140 Transcript_3764/m.5140 type:complete len:127 (-) Transcript_3764:58-438(-)